MRTTTQNVTNVFFSMIFLFIFTWIFHQIHLALKWQGMSPEPTTSRYANYNGAWILLVKLSSVKNCHPAQF